MTEGRTFYAALILAFVVFALIHFVPFKGSVPNFVRITGGGALFDTHLPKSSLEVSQRLERFGAEGRKEYVFRNLTTDILLPLAMLPAFFLGAKRVNRRFGLYMLALANWWLDSEPGGQAVAGSKTTRELIQVISIQVVIPPISISDISPWS